MKLGVAKIEAGLNRTLFTGGKVNPYSHSYDEVREYVKSRKAVTLKRNIGYAIASCAAAVILCLAVILPITLKSNDKTDSYVPHLYSFGYTASAEPSQTEDGLIILEDVENMIEISTENWTSSMVSHPIVPCYNGNRYNKKIEFEISSDNNTLPTEVEVASIKQWIKVNPGERISWTVVPIDEDRHAHAEKGLVYDDYINVILKENGNIIGISLIEIHVDKDTYYHYPPIIKSIIFPQVDGKYQRVTRDYAINYLSTIKSTEV